MLQDKDIFTIFAAGLEGTASPLYEIKNTIVKKDPKMNKTSTLLGNLLDTLRTPTLTSRRLSAPRRVMRVACKVPTNGLCPCLSRSLSLRLPSASRSLSLSKGRSPEVS